MTLGELRDLAAKKLKSYRDDCATVARWESETAILGGKSDNMGIRGSTTSDPTADPDRTPDSAPDRTAVSLRNSSPSTSASADR